MAISINWKNTLPDTPDFFTANLFQNISKRWYPQNIIGSNLFYIFDTYAQEFATGSVEITQVFQDLAIDTVRTGVIADRLYNKMYDNFGVLLDINKSPYQYYDQFNSGSVLNSYRTELKFLALSNLESMTPDALKRVGQAINGISPVVIQPLINYNGWVLTTYTGSVLNIFSSPSSQSYVVVDPPFGRYGTVLPITNPSVINIGDTISLSYSILGFNTVLHDAYLKNSGVLLYFFISTGSLDYTNSIQNTIYNAVKSVLPAYIEPTIYYSSDFTYWRPPIVSTDIFASGSNIIAISPHGWLYNATPTTPTGSQFTTDVIKIPSNTHSYNWFYDWAVITKNDARCDVEVRQYNSASIPSTIPWKKYDPTSPIQLFSQPSGSSLIAHWSMAAKTSKDSPADLLGNNNTLNNTTSTYYSNGLGISRRELQSILGSNTSLAMAGNNLLSTNVTGSFSWETYVYRLDANTILSGGELSIQWNSSGGYIIWDYNGYSGAKNINFSVNTTANSLVTASIIPYLQESGIPPQYHYFAGTYLQGVGLYLYIDGQKVAFQPYTGVGITPAVATYVNLSGNVFLDEAIMYTGFLDANTAMSHYNATKKKLRYLGMPSGSWQPYQQARFTMYASGSNEVEIHQFSVRGLQNTSASIMDPQFAGDLYALPVLTQSLQSIGQADIGVQPLRDACTRVQTATGSGVNAGSNLTYSINLTTLPTNGNTLVFIGSNQNTNAVGNITSIIQSGVTWTRVTSHTDILHGQSTGNCEIWIGNNISNATGSATINVTGSTNIISMGRILEYSGIIYPHTTDVIFFNDGTGSSFNQNANMFVAPSSPTEVWLVGTYIHGTSLGTYSAGVGFSNVGVTTNIQSKLSVDEAIVYSTSTPSDLSSISAGTGISWSSVLATFKY